MPKNESIEGNDMEITGNKIDPIVTESEMDGIPTEGLENDLQINISNVKPDVQEPVVKPSRSKQTADFQSVDALPVDNPLIKTDPDKDDDVVVTYIKKEHSEKTNVKVYIEKDTNGARGMYEIQINKASDVTLRDVKQHLMKYRRRYYKNFDPNIYDYCVNKFEYTKDEERVEGVKYLDENTGNNEVLPLLGDMIILNCWLKT